MDANRLNISKIETFFDTLLRGHVSDNVFFTSLPDAVEESWGNIVVVDCSAMADWNAFGRGTVLVMIYAPPMPSGRKNVAVMSSVEQKLNIAIERCNDSVYRIRRGETYSDYDSERKMFVNIVTVDLVVLT